jgi:CRISPR/Cas system-associated exonuclease Cas4 (RecB family)
MEEELLPVSTIRQYFFCPQIPYINLVLHVVEPETESMISGRMYHEKFRAQHLPREVKPRHIESPSSAPSSVCVVSWTLWLRRSSASWCRAR